MNIMLRTFAYLHFSGISSSVLCSLGAEDLLEISVVCSFYGICNIFHLPSGNFSGFFCSGDFFSGGFSYRPSFGDGDPCTSSTKWVGFTRRLVTATGGATWAKRGLGKGRNTIALFASAKFALHKLA